MSTLSILRWRTFVSPSVVKAFLKFWWDKELKQLKQDSIDSNKAWKDAGKTKSGPIFIKQQSCRLTYNNNNNNNN